MLSAFPGSFFLISYLGVSAWYFVVVRSGHILYPRWLAYLNPFLLSLLIALLQAANALPAVVNVLWPARLSIPDLIFFALSALVLWKAEKTTHTAHTQDFVVPQYYDSDLQ